MIVIDSSALIAFVKNEPGADRVEVMIGESIVSIVVLTECLSKLALQGFDPEATKARLLAAGLRVEPFGDSNMPAVIALHRLARQNISLADRFCLALALDQRLPVLTGDRPWAALGLPLEIELIR